MTQQEKDLKDVAAKNKFNVAKSMFGNEPNLLTMYIEDYVVNIFVSSKYFYEEIKEPFTKYGYKVTLGKPYGPLRQR